MSGLATASELRGVLLRRALFTVPGVLLLGIMSGRIANSGYGNPWFDALVKPDLMPPGWVFGAVWSVLYVLLGLVLALILHASPSAKRNGALTLFAIGLVMNLAWSPLFFAGHQVTNAFWLIIGMLAVTAALGVILLKFRPLAAWLLVPYLAWLCFAAFLTSEIGRLNPDAETLADRPARSQMDF